MVNYAGFPVAVVLVLVAGCAGFSCPDGQEVINGECASDAAPLVPPAQTKNIRQYCTWWPDTDDQDFPVEFSFELTVKPGPIVAGELFSAELSGWVSQVFLGLNDGLGVLNAFTRFATTEGRATVQVRDGAEGDDVTLVYDDSVRPFTCTFDEDGLADPDGGPAYPSCDPANQLPDGSNSDCVGTGAPVPEDRCLQYVDFTISEDCSPGGVCDRLSETAPGGPCDVAGFCIIEDAGFPLRPQTVSYRAAQTGSVLFGWDETDSVADLRESGPNRNTWEFPGIGPDAEIGPNGFRLVIRGIELVFDCAPGVAWWHPDAVNAEGLFSSPTPDSDLISFAIQPRD